MGASIPKQYLPLAGSTVLEKTLEKLLAVEQIEGVVVALDVNDRRWHELNISRHPRVCTCPGGAERSDSVLNALKVVQARTENDHHAWALVHDGARPCVSIERVKALIERALEASSGAILASPVTDTVKRVDLDHQIHGTEDRSALWLAHTPQMYPVTQLTHALHYCQKHKLSITDEASAVEIVGGTSLVVNDRRDNIKVTMPEDLAWAKFILENQTQCE